MGWNLPDGVSESDLPGCSREDEAFESWYEENEDRLLSEFLDGLKEEYGDTEEIAVKNWTKTIQEDFDSYVSREWDSVRDDGPDEDIDRDR